MSISEKLTTIAENEQKVYNAGYEKGKQEGGNTEEVFANGKAAGEKLMWDALTDNNKRTGWAQQFRNWQIEYLRPPYVISPKANAINAMFEGNKLLKKVESAYFDFSGYSPAQTLTTTAWYQIFQNCTALEEVEDLGMKAGGYHYTFNGCTSLKTIAIMRVQADTQYNNTFNKCAELKNITIAGTIGQNGFNISAAKNLSRNSILSILNACNKQDLTETVTITLPSYCIDGETDTEMLMSETGDNDLYNAAMLARSYGYSVAFA